MTTISTISAAFIVPTPLLHRIRPRSGRAMPPSAGRTTPASMYLLIRRKWRSEGNAKSPVPDTVQLSNSNPGSVSINAIFIIAQAGCRRQANRKNSPGDGFGLGSGSIRDSVLWCGHALESSHSCSQALLRLSCTLIANMRTNVPTMAIASSSHASHRL